MRFPFERLGGASDWPSCMDELNNFLCQAEEATHVLHMMFPAEGTSGKKLPLPASPPS